MKNTIKNIVASIVLAGTPTLLFAESQWQFLVEAERVTQSFSDGDADIDTFTFTPAVHLENWTLSAKLPWQHIDGTYFINNLYPNLTYVCSQLNNLTALQKLVLVRRDIVTVDQVQYCNASGGVVSGNLQDSVDGFTDIELFANYYLPALNETVVTAIGFGYKHDNGEVESGLGTGTQDAFTEFSANVDLTPVSILLTLGYEFILHNSTDVDMQDYGYLALDGRWQVLSMVAPGIEYHFLQANTDFVADFDYWVVYVQFGGSKGLGGRLFITDYQNEPGYPDDEIGASISYAF